MNSKPVPLPTPEDLAAERLVAAVVSAIGGIQERLPNLAADDKNDPRVAGSYRGQSRMDRGAARCPIRGERRKSETGGSQIHLLHQQETFRQAPNRDRREREEILRLL